jgi:hypothetical protein
MARKLEIEPEERGLAGEGLKAQLASQPTGEIMPIVVRYHGQARSLLTRAGRHSSSFGMIGQVDKQ